MLARMVTVAERDAVAIGYLGPDAFPASVIDMGRHDPPRAMAEAIRRAGTAPKPLAEGVSNLPRGTRRVLVTREDGGAGEHYAIIRR